MSFFDPWQSNVLHSLPHTLINEYLEVFMLIFARMTGFVMRAPVFSDVQLTALAKTAIIFALSLLGTSFVPHISSYHMGVHFLVGLIFNIGIGYLIGYIASLSVYTMQVAGEIIDIQTGLNSSVVFSGGVQATVFSQTMRFLALLVFLYFGGVEIVLLSLKYSFKILPVNITNIWALGFDLGSFIDMSKRVIIMGIIISSPILVTIVFTDIILAMMSRAAQQINPFQLSYAIKPILGMFILILCLPLIQNRMIAIFEQDSNVFDLKEKTLYQQTK